MTYHLDDYVHKRYIIALRGGGRKEMRKQESLPEREASNI